MIIARIEKKNKTLVIQPFTIKDKRCYKDEWIKLLRKNKYFKNDLYN